MKDNQWPRFMVFQKEGPDKPLLHNGSVHAADIELALLNARDVFARRPEASTMWVVPADAIFTRTREELGKGPENEEASQEVKQSTGQLNDQSTKRPVDWCVIGKLAESAQSTYLGNVKARSPQAALKAAIDTFADRDPLWWWVFPASAVLASAAEDADPMFAPARDKTYKRQAEYPVVTLMRQLHSKGKLDE